LRDFACIRPAPASGWPLTPSGELTNKGIRRVDGSTGLSSFARSPSYCRMVPAVCDGLARLAGLGTGTPNSFPAAWISLAAEIVSAAPNGAGEAMPPSKLLTGPASSGRLVCGSVNLASGPLAHPQIWGSGVGGKRVGIFFDWAALTLHFPEPIHPVPVVALNGPTTPSIPLRPVATTVDRIFTPWSNAAVGLVSRPHQHPAGTELLWSASDPLAG
jgi:hypothetical protein